MNRYGASCAGLLGLLLLAGGCEKKQPADPGPPVGGSTSTSAAPGTPAGWTLDVAALKPPDTPVAGRISGQEFRPDKIAFENNSLTFRSGKEFFADTEVKIFLTGESLENLVVEVKPDQEFGINVPHVHMGAKKPGQPFANPEMFVDKFALKLELGKIEGGKLTGKIHLCLPDAAKSYLAGAFAVDATSLGTSRIVGNVRLPAGTKEIKLGVGYLGHDKAGKPHSGWAGFPVGPEVDGSAGSFASQLKSSRKDGVTFRHGQVPAGSHLVFVTWGERALAWKWVDVADRSEVRVDLAVETGGLGDLEVKLPDGAKERRTRLLPLDPDGKLPPKAGNAAHLATQLSNYVGGTAAEAPAGKDTVTFTGLRPGTYRVLAGQASADVVVKAGSRATAALK